MMFLGVKVVFYLYASMYYRYVAQFATDFLSSFDEIWPTQNICHCYSSDTKKLHLMFFLQIS